MARASITECHVPTAPFFSVNGKMTDRARAWCFTMWTEEDVNRLRDLPDVLALVVGREICPKTGKLHFQGYVRFKQVKRLSWWKNQFPTTHAEQRKGTEDAAAEYCRKDGQILFDFGTERGVPQHEGEDVTVHVMRMIDADAPDWQVRREHPKFYFHNNRKIKDYRADVEVWKTQPRYVAILDADPFVKAQTDARVLDLKQGYELMREEVARLKEKYEPVEEISM